MGKREAVSRKGNKWQEREQAQADKGACRGTQGARRSRKAISGRKGSKHRQTREHAEEHREHAEADKGVYRGI